MKTLTHNKHSRRAMGLFLYFVIPGIGAASPLVLYPAIARSYGASGFGAFAIGQSVGAAIGIVAELGWSVIGPQRIARESPAQRSETHAMSLASKSVSLAIGIPTAACVALYISDAYQVDSALIAISFAVSAISPVWLLMGMNRPGLILMVESLPRLILNLAAAAAIFLGGPLYMAALVNILVVLIALWASKQTAKVRIYPVKSDFRPAFASLREHRVLTAGRAVSVTYTSFTTAIVGGISPGAVPAYSAADRLMRMGLNVVAGLPNRLQSWVGLGNDQGQRRRSRLSLAANTALGVTAGLAFLLLSRPVADLVYARVLGVSPHTAVVGALIVTVICLSRGLGLSLVAEGMASWIAAANIMAALSGVIALVVLVGPFGVTGAFLAILLAELVGVVVQSFALVLSDLAVRRQQRQGT